MHKILFLTAISFVCLNINLVFGQETITGTVASTVSLGNNEYAIIITEDIAASFKTSPYKSGQLKTKQKVSLQLVNQGDKVFEVLAETLDKKLFARPIENKSRIKRKERGVTPGNTCPFDYCEAQYPIGGGEDYLNIVTGGDIVITSTHVGGTPKTAVELGNELKSTIESAPNGTTIFVESDCHALVESSINITTEIIIASDRGNAGSLGAIIELDDSQAGYGRPLFNVDSDNVRISGFRLKGHLNESVGAVVQDYKFFEFDNNHAYDWGVASVVEENSVNKTVDLTEFAYLIHHNYFQNCHHQVNSGTAGYGVAVWNAFAQIYANKFKRNRHDIAGKGDLKSGYNVYCNNFAETYASTGIRANVDMHNNPVTEPEERRCGGFMRVHHNDFLWKNPGASAIWIAGKPQVLLLVDNNRFANETIFWDNNCAIVQIRDTQKDPLNRNSLHGNIVAVNNIYDEAYLGVYARETWDKTRTDNHIRIPSTNDLLHSANIKDVNYRDDNTAFGIDKDEQILDFSFGDFDGDGRTDIFMSDGDDWWYLPLNTDYANEWNHLANSTYQLGKINLLSGTGSLYIISPHILLSNFDNNNTTDAFLPTGSDWLVAYGCNTNWAVWANSGYTFSNARFGKFHHPSYNDEIGDAFQLSSGWVNFSYDGNSWQQVSQTGYAISQLRVGDFNGDGTDDIFLATGSEFYYSDNGATNWQFLATSSLPMDRFVIGDFTGDGNSDIIGHVNGGWNIAVGGNTTWSPALLSNFNISLFQYGDLD